MAVSGTVTARGSVKSPFIARLLAALKPLESGPPATRSLDGLRAVAALSVLAYHLCLVLGVKNTAFGAATYNYWHYFATGVDLFFVLSGFLLFLPYARAMLHGKALPSAGRFYKRRALRILPAYLVCLTILAILPTSDHTTPLSVGDIVTHLLFIHDAFPLYNRDLEGPFWTLAVEVQFYLFLPLLAAGMAWVVGTSRSRWRLVSCLLALIAGGILLRYAAGIVGSSVTSYSLQAPPSSSVALVFVMVTNGMQGKFIDVFAAGMLCSVVYIIVKEDGALSRARSNWIGAACLVVAAALVLFIAIPNSVMSEALFVPNHSANAKLALYPLLMGGSYGGLVIGVLLGFGAIRAIFEFVPLRFIGLISYSLYLWHLPVISNALPLFNHLPLKVDILSTVLVAYLSYQLVERPFLRRRQRISGQDQANTNERIVPVLSGEAAALATVAAPSRLWKALPARIYSRVNVGLARKLKSQSSREDTNAGVYRRL